MFKDGTDFLVERSHMDSITPPYCARGSRRWAEHLGLDWSSFVLNGIPASVLEATGDGMALKLVEYVRSLNGQR